MVHNVELGKPYRLQIFQKEKEGCS